MKRRGLQSVWLPTGNSIQELQILNHVLFCEIRMVIHFCLRTVRKLVILWQWMQFWSLKITLKIRAGDVLARIPRESTKTRDITGGLPRVAELFEARRPKDAAIISEYDGRIEFGKDHKTKRRVLVVPDDETIQPMEYLIPKGKHISVQEGEQVKRGDIIMDGNMVPHDILRILGIEALASYLINEIQEVYRLQGVPINDKHIEVIVRQMMQKVEIIEPGETTFLLGEQVDKQEFEKENARAIAEGRRPAQAHAVLQGITKASLQTQSFFSAASLPRNNTRPYRSRCFRKGR